MIIKNVHTFWYSSKNTLPLKYKFWMIKMYEEGFEPQTTSQPQELSHLSVLCLWGWMRDGTKFNSIFLILLEELMVAIILRLCEWLFMQIVGLGGSIFQIDFIAKKSCLLNSSCFYLFRNNNDFDCILWFDNM